MSSSFDKFFYFFWRATKLFWGFGYSYDHNYGYSYGYFFSRKPWGFRIYLILSYLNVKTSHNLYVYVYDNGTASVRKDSEVVYTVDQAAIDALVTEISNAYVAYENFRAGN